MLAKKKYVVTGYSSSIGQELISDLHVDSNIVFVGRSEPRVIAMNDDWFQTDVSDIDSLKLAIDGIRSASHEIDGVVHIAGVSSEIGLGKELDEDTFARDMESILHAFRVNVLAFYALVSGCSQLLSNSSIASCVLVASIGGHRGFPSNPGYVSSKHAALGLVKSMALDFARWNIRINSVSPGYIRDSGMTRASWADSAKRFEREEKTVMRRWGYPREVSSAIGFLLSDASSYMTGSDLIIDGGWLSKGL